MRTAFARTAQKDEFRLCQFSIQRDHLHLACEADSNRGLSRGMQGLEISFAKRVNRVLGRKGKVFADRFHAVPVRSPRQLRNTLCYVLNNGHRHDEPRDPRWNGIDPLSSAWHFDGWRHDRWRRGLSPPAGEPAVAPAASWLMKEGWMRSQCGSCVEATGQEGWDDPFVCFYCGRGVVDWGRRAAARSASISSHQAS
jgi:hypothetical protein